AQATRTRQRVGGAGERGREAVALALFNRTHPVMGGDDVGHDLVEARDRSGHLVGLDLPQPRGALDVCQEQRHRSRRQQLAHAKVAPVDKRCVRAWIDLAHASQHAATTWAKHQRKAHTAAFRGTRRSRGCSTGSGAKATIKTGDTRGTHGYGGSPAAGSWTPRGTTGNLLCRTLFRASGTPGDGNYKDNNFAELGARQQGRYAHECRAAEVV